MVKYSNKYGLPFPIVNAIMNDPYDAGDCDISTTRLINPPQLETLKKRHGNEIEEDVSERIWALVGQSVHTILERATPGDKRSEQRFFSEMEGWKISGAVDLLMLPTLIDYKVTSVWAYIYGSRNKEWTAQGNVNRWLCHQNGVEINALKNVLILRDWIKSKANGSDYPPVQVVTVDLPLWPLKEAESFIRERILAHRAAASIPDDQLAEFLPCSDEDRWHNSRTGKYTRCESYCQVSAFCNQNGKKV